MGKSCRRFAPVLLCLLACSVTMHAEPLGDFITKIHDWYVSFAVPISILMLVAIAVMGFFSEHRRWAIWLGGVAMVFLFNVAGTFLDGWIPPAT